MPAGWRQKNPWTALAAVVAIAGGMAVAITGFSLLWGCYFAELPFEHAGRIVSVRDIEQPDPDDTPPKLSVFREWERRQSKLDLIAASYRRLRGIAAVMVFSVAQRTREIGIRLALGADRRSILGVVLRRGIFQISIGIAFGSALGWALLRLMQSVPIGMASGGAGMPALAAAAMGVSGLLACIADARRQSGGGDPQRVGKRLVPFSEFSSSWVLEFFLLRRSRDKIVNIPPWENLEIYLA